MIRRPPRSTQSRSSAASDVYKRQPCDIDKNERFITIPCSSMSRQQVFPRKLSCPKWPPLFLNQPFRHVCSTKLRDTNLTTLFHPRQTSHVTLHATCAHFVDPSAKWQHSDWSACRVGVVCAHNILREHNLARVLAEHKTTKLIHVGWEHFLIMNMRTLKSHEPHLVRGRLDS